MYSMLKCLAARAKMSLSRAQNIFMPANINSIVVLYWCVFVKFVFNWQLYFHIGSVDCHNAKKKRNVKRDVF